MTAPRLPHGTPAGARRFLLAFLAGLVLGAPPILWARPGPPGGGLDPVAECPAVQQPPPPGFTPPLCQACHTPGEGVMEFAGLLDRDASREREIRQWRRRRAAQGTMVRDDEPPLLDQARIPEIYRGQPLAVTVRIRDASGIQAARLYYRTRADARYRALALEPLGEDRYQAVLEPAITRSTWLKYYFSAEDGEGNGPTTLGGPSDPFYMVLETRPTVAWPVYSALLTIILSLGAGVGYTSWRFRQRRRRELDREFWHQVLLPVLRSEGFERSRRVAELVGSPLCHPWRGTIRLSRRELYQRLDAVRQGLGVPPGPLGGRKAAGFLLALLSLGGFLPTPAQAQTAKTYLGLALYDQYSRGTGTNGNRNRVKLLDALGSLAPLVYYAESQSAIPSVGARTFSRGIALDAHPVPGGAPEETFSRDVYVTDPGNHRLRRFEYGPSGGSSDYRLLGSGNPAQYLYEWGAYGDALGVTDAGMEFSYPRDLAVHPLTHDLYVADTMNSRIQVFEFTTDPARATPRPLRASAAVAGGGAYQVQQINAVSSHAFGRRRDWRDPPPPPLPYLGTVASILDTNGEAVGVAQLGQGDLYYPHGIALDVDTQGTADLGDDVTYLYVADTWNHRVQVFKDTTPGYASLDFQFLRMWGGYGKVQPTDPARGRFAYPKGIGVWRNPADADDTRIYVIDSRNQRIQVFRKAQDETVVFLTEWGDADDFLNLQDLAVDAAGNVYVTDPWNDQLSGQRRTRLQKFDKDGNHLAHLGAAPLTSNTHYPFGIATVQVTEVP